MKEELLKDVFEWCIYQHGRGTSNEHFHICTPHMDGSSADVFRRNIRIKFGLSGSGNGKRDRAKSGYSGKEYNNGMRSFVFYCGHEDCEAVYKGPNWATWIRDCEINGFFEKNGQKRVDAMLEKKIPVDESKWGRDRNWCLSYNNVVRVAVKYHYKYKTPPTLIGTLKHMMDHSRWRPMRDMEKGLTTFLIRDFEFQIGTRPHPDYGWIRCVD